ncbi:GGDEF domain-containing protein [Paludisphaera mucosa]|uniref:diguanylate cyclase n=1 Tax=Paludisphaera mucosa TaxID=3030827 RepID=A0ABT6F826_9BACT|nr:GGDEF domain-containing protein [Paludisphaera mucosa]MDG3003736.1 GGDEF domain-containing protein [Paludisphaera mucosa]
MDLKATTHICVSPVKAEDEDTQVVPSQPMYLIVVHGGTTGTMLRIDGPETSLGRGGDNTHQFHEATVSRRHAVLSHRDEGLSWLTDLGSSNGSFVDSRRIPPRTPVRIEDGARIQLGAAVVLKYVSLDPCDERFQREMFERTVRDNLTGLYNRAYFLEQIGPLCERNQMRNLGTAILMVDVDHFKRVNDTYGHDIGDAALREVAKSLRDSTRSDDLVARYGGEEFIIALPVASTEQALERAEQIRLMLARRTVRAGRRELRITASVGLSCSLLDRPRTVNALIATADIALYEAKRSGRDRVVDAGRLLLDAERRTESCDAVAV